MATKESCQTISLSCPKCFTMSTLFMLYDIGKVCFNQIGTYGFEAKREKERFIVVCPSFHQNLPCENWSFYVVVLTSTGEKCIKMRASRAARSFLPANSKVFFLRGLPNMREKQILTSVIKIQKENWG